VRKYTTRYLNYPPIVSDGSLTINEDVSHILIYMYMNEAISETFTITVQYQEAQYINAIALYTSIGVFVLICFICSLFFYRCSKTVFGNRDRQNAQAIVELREARQSLQEKNNMILMNLFENELGPQDLKEDINYYKIQTCSICLEGLANEKVSTLACKHIFHTTCLKDWLFKDLLKPKCPNCNYYIIEQENVNVNTNNPGLLSPAQSEVVNANVVLIRPPELNRDS
jgi:hypothetical protein